MILGFTGTRQGMTPEQASALAGFLEETQPATVHHGDCIGADEQFHRIVRAICPNTIIVIHPPSDPKHRAWCDGDYSRQWLPYIERNHHIVDECDLLVATPSGPEKLRSGTWATIRYAGKTGRETKILAPEAVTTS